MTIGQALGSLVLLVRFELTDSGLHALIPLDRPVMFCEVAANAGAFCGQCFCVLGVRPVHKCLHLAPNKFPAPDTVDDIEAMVTIRRCKIPLHM